MSNVPITNYRERALDEHGEECHVCGRGENIVVHHRDGNRANNELENLVPLCRTCHAKVHSRDRDVADLVRELGFKPMGRERTTIPVTGAVADALYERKGRKETYADVIYRLLHQAEDDDA